MTPHRLRYQSPASTQTLAEGLAEYRAAHPALKRDHELFSAEARQFFRSHDLVHVLYGCDTTMPDEAIVKIASLFGTTGGLGVMRGYLHHESLDIYRRLPPAGTLLAILLAPYLVLRTLWRCARQPRRWPWVEHAQYLDSSLADLRASFGIRVAHRNDQPG